MTTKKRPKQNPKQDVSSAVATVNWEGIARFLGQPVENVEQVRRMALQPAVSSPGPSSPKR